MTNTKIPATLDALDTPAVINVRPFRVAFYVVMAGMVLTAPVWGPFALCDLVRGKLAPKPAQ